MLRRASRVTGALSRPDAIVALLALPDPIDLVGRGYVVTCPRSPFTDTEAIKRDLGTAYVAWRRHDHADQSAVIAVRRHPRWQIVRRA